MDFHLHHGTRSLIKLKAGVEALVALTMLGVLAFSLSGCGGGSGGGVSSGGTAASAHNLWTWTGGSDVAYTSGNFGALGVTSASNAPSARCCTVSWKDSNGNAWIFGGEGVDSTGVLGYLNDLWKYDGSNWTWMGGSSGVNAVGSYVSHGTAGMPSARFNAVSWTDKLGNFWLFGGTGMDSTGARGNLNDLWEFNGSQWIWVSGSSGVNAAGSYGSSGVAAAGNTPGSRYKAVSWSDSAGKLWLFGGYGNDGAGSLGYLNDLWRFDGSNWAWIGGSSAVNATGSYGTQGTPAAANMPGARTFANGWTDAAGNAWLFGGNGYDGAGSINYLNDLWKFDGSNWAWMGGSSSVKAAGSYGTQGSAAPGNMPGARTNATAWTDSTGNLWLFSGFGYDSNGTSGNLNDLWKFDGSNWTWVGGSNVIVTSPGSYGSQGVAAAGNLPGARQNAAAWTDSAGNLMLFGGFGYDAAGTRNYLNDLWRYQP